MVWSETFLVLQDLMPDANCGGAHGNSSLSYITWSLQRGEPVDTWSWIQGGQDSMKLRKDAAGAEVESALLRVQP